MKIENLIEKIENLKNNEEIRRKVKRRIKKFREIGKSKEKVFSELCFCILTANWKAEGAISIQKELSSKNIKESKETFINISKKRLEKILKTHGHRFHQKRVEYIYLARKKHLNIKRKIDKIKDDYVAREWIVKNVKGLGYKEASHFLRNIGRENVAIIDRHVLNLLLDYGIIKKPNSLTKKRYLEIEKVLKKISEKTNLSLGELDLYLWYMKTGKILK